MAKLTIDIQPFIEKRMSEIHAAIEQGCHALLEEAFEAGMARGDFIRAEWDGFPRQNEPPCFDQWVEQLIARNRQD